MIDLHMHSRYSEDGEYTPLELVEQCVKTGVRMNPLEEQTASFCAWHDTLIAS